MTTGLACPAPDPIVEKLDAARRLLAAGRDATEAKHVADLARAAEVYGKRQQLAEGAIAAAPAIKIDAMTLMGEFLGGDLLALHVPGRIG